MPDLAAVAKAIQDEDQEHWITGSGANTYRCTCGSEVRVPDITDHRYDAMARAAADALGVST